MEEIAEVYARALFEARSTTTSSTRSTTSSASSPTRWTRASDLRRFFFSPYFSTEEKKDALKQDGQGRRAEPFMNFLEALIERHRMPVIFRIRARFDQLWEEEHKLLPVQVTSAVELDESTIKEIGDRMGEQAGRQVELSSDVDPEIIGGIVLRVGNFVLDASIRNRLEQLRKQVAQA